MYVRMCVCARVFMPPSAPPLPHAAAAPSTSPQVIDQILIPLSAQYQCRFVDIVPLVDQRDVGKPHYFISHAWMNPFSYLVNTLTQYLSGAVDKEVRVWVSARGGPEPVCWGR